MAEVFDATAFAESVADMPCLNATIMSLQALQATISLEKAEALATAMCQSNTLTEEVASSTNVFFLLFSGYLVFVMQAGFAMLCAGSVRSKNTMNILMKNVLDALIGAICFYLLGYGFAYGTGADYHNGFIGAGDFGFKNTRLDTDGTLWSSFFFQWAFSAAAATIVSGSVAERSSFIAYLGYSAFLTAFVYPVVVHWIWSTDGWLNAFRADPFLDMGLIDFAGSGVVHMVGGTAGLVGAAIVGPRLGRFDAEGKPVAIRGHSATMVVLGTFLLWFGWYGFNPGSQLLISSAANANIVARVAVTTTLAPAMAGVTSLFLVKITTKTWDLLAVCNGLLCGLVAVTAGCSVLEPWAALLVGFLAAFVFYFAEKLLLALKIDDPLAAAPMHCFCGMLGVLYVGFLAYEPYVLEVYGDKKSGYGQGVLYGGNGHLLACQIVGVICIFAWVSVWMGVFFYVLNMVGMFRASQEEELAGMDVSKHGGTAYEVTTNDALKSSSPNGF